MPADVDALLSKLPPKKTTGRLQAQLSASLRLNCDVSRLHQSEICIGLASFLDLSSTVVDTVTGVMSLSIRSSPSRVLASLTAE